ncbi:hypothetical protein GCM10028784_17250 [Myceligenerans cantabricum]
MVSARNVTTSSTANLRDLRASAPGGPPWCGWSVTPVMWRVCGRGAAEDKRVPLQQASGALKGEELVRGNRGFAETRP